MWVAEKGVLGLHVNMWQVSVTLETIEVTHGRDGHRIEIVDTEFIGSTVPVSDMIVLTGGEIEDF